MQKETYKELKFHRYFKEYANKALKTCKFIKSEESLYGYFDILQDELNIRQIFAENIKKIEYRSVGRIDVLFFLSRFKLLWRNKILSLF